jgi:hypothetical protein
MLPARGCARSKKPKVAASWFAAAIQYWLTGCTSATGLLVADVERSDGALIVAVSGLGATMRTVPTDAGFSIGYERRVYVYPEAIDWVPAEGRRYFYLRLPDPAPVASSARVVGLDLRTSSPEFGLTVGYREMTSVTPISAGDSVYIHLVFVPDEKGSTRLTYCREESPCWPATVPSSAVSSR